MTNDPLYSYPAYGWKMLDSSTSVTGRRGTAIYDGVSIADLVKRHINSLNPVIKEDYEMAAQSVPKFNQGDAVRIIKDDPDFSIPSRVIGAPFLVMKSEPANFKGKPHFVYTIQSSTPNGRNGSRYHVFEHQLEEHKNPVKIGDKVKIKDNPDFKGEYIIENISFNYPSPVLIRHEDGYKAMFEFADVVKVDNP